MASPSTEPQQPTGTTTAGRDHPAARIGVLLTDDADDLNPRERHIQLIAEKGRMAWQWETGYGRRNHVETTIARYKHLIGPKLCTHSLPAQLGEVVVAVAVLNRMIRLAKPLSVTL